MRKSIPVKEIIALLMSMLMLFSAVSALADGEAFTVDPYKNYDTLFKIDVDTDAGCAFVETQESAENLAFHHSYDVDGAISIIYSDILVLDYYKSSRTPIFRTWICYAGDTPHYFQSVTFEFEGKKYTFSDIGDPEWVEKKDYGYSEKLLIRYGKNNTEFFAAVLAAGLTYVADKSEDKKAPTMKMTLHGLKDIETEVPESFWLDFALLGVPFMGNDGAWMKYIVQNGGDACTVTDVTQ